VKEVPSTWYQATPAQVNQESQRYGYTPSWELVQQANQARYNQVPNLAALRQHWSLCTYEGSTFVLRRKLETDETRSSQRWKSRPFKPTGPDVDRTSFTHSRPQIYAQVKVDQNSDKALSTISFFPDKQNAYTTKSLVRSGPVRLSAMARMGEQLATRLGNASITGMMERNNPMESQCASKKVCCLGCEGNRSRSLPLTCGAAG
jgi:hypothetical protein